ncbi:jg18280 [Pararge aegeria aegeria]|uniref:Jg18280 protein n=1 Tax=Pararge aegeria aegeria TaxID=348720 RepID=A0A8S4SFG7_9NEOP|nr:jg18280 [Pararge aegeria aegeria]
MVTIRLIVDEFLNDKAAWKQAQLSSLTIKFTWIQSYWIPWKVRTLEGIISSIWRLPAPANFLISNPEVRSTKRNQFRTFYKWPSTGPDRERSHITRLLAKAEITNLSHEKPTKDKEKR